MSEDDHTKDDGKPKSAAAAKVGTIAVSSSIAVIMTSAMAQAASSDVVKIDGESEVSDELGQAITNAIGKRSIRDAVSDSMHILVSGIEKDGETLSDKYLDGQSLNEWLLAQADSGSDQLNEGLGTNARAGGGGGITGCYANCHSACHGACHGSRGWR